MTYHHIIHRCLRLGFLFALLLSCASVRGEDYRLYVSLKSGNEVFFHLSEYPVVTFDGNGVVINAKGTFETHLYDDVADLHFTNLTTTPIDEASGCFGFHYLSDETVRLTGLKGTEKISLYDASGRMLQMPFHGSTDDLTISLSHLSRGSYVIRVDNQSYKIYKK